MANYRQTVLTAFQQVEDELSALRTLERETGAVNETIQSAQKSLDITTAQYKAGTTTYLQVETSQTALFGEQRTAVDLLTRRMVASVLLIEALGGGWDSSQLPAVSELSANDKRAKN
jgi:outer membrane protein TolC